MNTEKSDELVKLDLPERTLAVKELAGTSGKHADSALAAIAHVEGDQAAIQILEGLNPIELGQILKDHDVSVPAISAWLADPQKLTAMLVMDPLDWENVLNENIFKLQYDALVLLTSIICSTDDPERQKAVLQTLAANENSFFYLCFPFIGEEILDEEDEDEEEDPFDGDADDLADEAEIVEAGAKILLGLKTITCRDSGYQELVNDLMNVIDDVMPELAERIQNFISIQSQRNETWHTVMDHILDLRAAAQEAMAETKDGKEEEYVSMFEVKKKE
ncbi:MAG: hypothetical protein NTX82_01090 [Candidatus Parcubacteria bacterium]|nr:hypothetical protein [Candidatus Parcubacteria bacterium]